MDMLRFVSVMREVYLNGSEIEDGFDFKMPDLVANLRPKRNERPAY